MSQNGNKIEKAMILAAGLGTRLKPLTNKTPKPLLQVKGKALIDHNLTLLKKAGIKEVVINLHHLGAQIKKHVGSGKKYGFKVHYTNEPKILGTGGGIKNAEEYLKSGAFVVINADVLIALDLKKAIAYHFKKGGYATMVVRKLKKGEDYAKLDIAKDGRLKGFGSGVHMYTGVQILTPIIFRLLEKPSCLIESGYKKLLEFGLPIYCFNYSGHWNDVGTIERLNEANKR